MYIYGHVYCTSHIDNTDKNEYNRDILLLSFALKRYGSEKDTSTSACISDNFSFTVVVVRGNSVKCMSWFIADVSAWIICRELRCVCFLI